MTKRNPFANWPRGGYPSGNKPVSELKPPPANITSKAPSSPTETTGGYLPPDDCHSTTHAAQYRKYRAMHEAELAERDATIQRMGKVGADAIDLLTKERDEALANLDDAEARIERLWAQLNEATNVPHNDPEFGFDKTAALSDPDEDAPSQVTPMCRVHPDHFMPCSRCLGYGCTACDRGIQAADDRRSL